MPPSEHHIRVLVSACLLGEKVRFNGADALSTHPLLAKWIAEGRVVPFCPEVAGGLEVPRPAAEILGGDGGDVLDLTSRILTAAGHDVTASFLRGAHLAVARAGEEGVGLAVLKDGSPSCGTGVVHDGTFTGTMRAGKGVTAALLTRLGIPVFSERQLEEAEALLEQLEQDQARDRSGRRRDRGDLSSIG